MNQGIIPNNEAGIMDGTGPHEDSMLRSEVDSTYTGKRVVNPLNNGLLGLAGEALNSIEPGARTPLPEPSNN